MDLTPENKRKIYIAGGVILLLFIIGLMLKFWVYSLLAIACFGAGFFYGRSTKKEKKKEEKKIFF